MLKSFNTHFYLYNMTKHVYEKNSDSNVYDRANLCMVIVFHCLTVQG